LVGESIGVRRGTQRIAAREGETGVEVFTCSFDSSRQCGFNAASGMFVDSDQNVLRLYASKAWRPDDSNAPMTFVEYF
jgi:hypothetical protein